MKTSLMLSALLLVSLQSVAENLKLGESVKVDVSGMKERWYDYAVKPWIDNTGKLRILAAQSGVFKVMDTTGAVLSETKVTDCGDSIIIVNESASKAAVLCDKWGKSMTFVDLNSLRTTTIDLPGEWISKDGTRYINRNGKASFSKAISEEIGQGTLITQEILVNDKNPKDQITQIRTYSVAQEKEISSVELKGYASEVIRHTKNGARFFYVGEELHMVFISTFYDYQLSSGSSSEWGDRVVVATINLTKGTVVNKIETAYKKESSELSDTRCLEQTDLVSVEGKTFLIAKSNWDQQPYCMPESLNIPWKAYKKGHIQLALINPLTFKSEKVIQSKILPDWEFKPFHHSLNIYLDSVTEINGRPALRSSFQNMAKEDDTAVYIDLIDGTQRVGPFGDGSVKLGSETISIGYDVISDIEKTPDTLIVNSMNRNGAELLKVKVPACSFNSLCNSDPDQFELLFGGSVVTKGQLLFTVINRDRDELTVVRLK